MKGLLILIPAWYSATTETLAIDAATMEPYGDPIPLAPQGIAVLPDFSAAFIAANYSTKRYALPYVSGSVPADILADSTTLYASAYTGLVAAKDPANALRVYDGAGSLLTQDSRSHAAGVSFSSDGSVCVVAVYDSALGRYVIETRYAATGAVIRTLDPGPGSLFWLEASPDCTEAIVAVYANGSEETRRYNLITGEVVSSGAYGSTTAVSPDLRYVLFAIDGMYVLRDGLTWAAVGSIQSRAAPTFSRDGLAIAMLEPEARNVIELYDTATYSLLTTTTLPEGYAAQSLAWVGDSDVPAPAVPAFWTLLRQAEQIGYEAAAPVYPITIEAAWGTYGLGYDGRNGVGGISLEGSSVYPDGRLLPGQVGEVYALYFWPDAQNVFLEVAGVYADWQGGALLPFAGIEINGVVFPRESLEYSGGGDNFQVFTLPATENPFVEGRNGARFL